MSHFQESLIALGLGEALLRAQLIVDHGPRVEPHLVKRHGVGFQPFRLFIADSRLCQLPLERSSSAACEQLLYALKIGLGVDPRFGGLFHR